MDERSENALEIMGKDNLILIGAGVGGGTIFLVAILIIIFLIWRRKKKQVYNATRQGMQKFYRISFEFHME